MDSDSETGFLYIAGTTHATELLISGASKKVFVAFFNGQDYVWIRVINEPSIDTVEFMSAMGSSSQILVLYVTKSNQPYIPVIMTISKSDGSLVRGVEINYQEYIGNVNPPSKQSYKFQLMSA